MQNKTTPYPEIKQPKHCPILEAITSRNTDMCMKDKLEDFDLDILGVPHVGRSRMDCDLVGVSDLWLD